VTTSHCEGQKTVDVTTSHCYNINIFKCKNACKGAQRELKKKIKHKYTKEKHKYKNDNEQWTEKKQPFKKHEQETINKQVGNKQEHLQWEQETDAIHLGEREREKCEIVTFLQFLKCNFFY